MNESQVAVPNGSVPTMSQGQGNRDKDAEGHTLMRIGGLTDDS